jgi:polysaccharide export outer membrane protein
MTAKRSVLTSSLGLAAMVTMTGLLAGCEVDSFFNPSVAGYWEHTATTIPVLDRLDTIEQDDSPWGETTSVEAEDLYPSDLSYRLVPGDYITVGIFELYGANQWFTSTRRIDPGGFIRIPELGDVMAAGLTAQELEDALVAILHENYIRDPQVDVVLQEGGAGFHYTIYGSVPSPGLFTLRAPDLRLLDALAMSGGVSNLIDTIYIIRQVELTEETKNVFERDAAGGAAPPAGGDDVNIEDLIEDLDDGGVSPGVLRQDGEPAIDIDQLEPAGVGAQPQVDIDDVRTGADVARARGTGSWVYVEERGEWVRIQTGEEIPPEAMTPGGPAPLYAERVIEIPNKRLMRGESKFNVVIRPNDRIYVEPPASGVVYIGGEINRPGVYNLPVNGKLTLSRLIDAAGGFGQLAIPDRVDLVRKVGDDREAIIRLNLGAIRQRTEPDIYLKPDDHIIIGTNWLATPLAIIRNGFRATYGFGFLLDRNFGNDVFGAPPVNNQNN